MEQATVSSSTHHSTPAQLTAISSTHDQEHVSSSAPDIDLSEQEERAFEQLLRHNCTSPHCFLCFVKFCKYLEKLVFQILTPLKKKIFTQPHFERLETFFKDLYNEYKNCINHHLDRPPRYACVLCYQTYIFLVEVYLQTHNAHIEENDTTLVAKFYNDMKEMFYDCRTCNIA